MKSTRYTNIVLNEKCMCWCFIDYTTYIPFQWHMPLLSYSTMGCALLSYLFFTAQLCISGQSINSVFKLAMKHHTLNGLKL